MLIIIFVIELSDILYASSLEMILARSYMKVIGTTVKTHNYAFKTLFIETYYSSPPIRLSKSLQCCSATRLISYFNETFSNAFSVIFKAISLCLYK